MDTLARDWQLARAQARVLLTKHGEHDQSTHGNWADGSSSHPGKGYSKDAKLIKGVIHTNNVYDAARALHEDRPVELEQPRTASILIDRLGEITREMIEKGEKAPHFNLCRATIKGTSLFCADTAGIPRVQMPQIPEGRESEFRDFLAAKGYALSAESEFASYLHATQNELNGAKVAGIAQAMRADPNRFRNPVFVSRDNYILDGHHRWASKVGIDAQDNVLGNESKQDVIRVDISITDLLKEADEFTGGAGKVTAADEAAEDLGLDTERDRSRKKRWLAIRAQSLAVLRRFDPSQPRDEHGRWTDGGGSDDVGGDGGKAPAAPALPKKYDIAKVEAKTRENVKEASEQARKQGHTPLPGSKGEHPATIASRNPTAKGSKKNPPPPPAYGQPDTASMKLEPARYKHDIGLLENDDFYQNFRNSDFKGGTDKAVSNVVGQLKDNLKWLYGYADRSAGIWYDGARALVDDRVELWGFNDASVAGVYAALSPTKDWDQNVHIADMLMQTYKTRQDHKWDDKMQAKAAAIWSAANQKIVAKVKGKTLGELTDAREKAIWIRTYDEAHNSRDYREVLPNGALGKFVRNADGSRSKVVWQSVPSITNAINALEANGDRDKISAAMGTAHKVRSFYNNILDPHSANGDVTIDTHAVGAALLRQLSGDHVPVAHNFGNTLDVADQPEGWEAAGSSTKTGLSGLYPVYAQAYREAASELGIQPRQLQSAVWVVKRNTFGTLSKKDQEAVEALWRSYHDDPKVTLDFTRSEIARILRLAKHERFYAVDAGRGRRADARELHQPRVGQSDPAMDRRAGAGAAAGAAGLDAVRGEERRAGPEVIRGSWDESEHPRDSHGRFTDSGGGDDLGSAPAPAPKIREAIGKDLDHPNLASLKEAVDRGAWDLTIDKVRTYGSEKTTQIGISAPVPDDWVSHTIPTGSVRHYDPKKAGIDADGYVVPSVDTEAALPKTATPGVIYRGMSYEEYQAALKSGQFASVGGYNLGEEQVGLTYYSSDPEQAQSYAHGFAPWQFKAVPGRPAVIVGIADPGSHVVNPHLPTELGIDKPVSTSEIREVYFGNPIISQPGYVEVVQESGRPPMEGSRLSPSITVEWQKVDAPAPAPSGPEDEMLFVSEQPNQAKLDRWNGVLTARSEELAAAGQAGNREDSQIGQMQTALRGFMQEPQENLDKEVAGLNAVYDSEMKLQAAAFSYVRDKVVTIQNIGALHQQAGVKVLQQVEKKFASQADRFEAEVWEDDAETLAMFEEAGFHVVDPGPGSTGGRVTVAKGAEKLAGGGASKSRATLQLRAEQVAVKLDFKPSHIEYVDEDRDFELAGQKYKYAGSYQRGEPTVKLYMNQINAENIKGITAHEIGHRKFEMLRNQHAIQTELMMQDKGPPPDPSHRYWWGRRGGTDAIMTPTGELRPPYDEKYPIVHAWAVIQNMRPSLEQDDGITEYSKIYWKEWEKGQMPTSTAYHETMAEMSRNLGVMGRHSAVTGKAWRALYGLQEEVWDRTDERMRDVSLPPIKSIFVIDGIQWEVR